jgi:hypothetical protein
MIEAFALSSVADRLTSLYAQVASTAASPRRALGRSAAGEVSA